MNEEAITGKIIGCAMKVHRALGCGFLESVYQNALAYELQKAGLKAECEVPITVFYEGIDVGEFYADLLVEKQVIVENKAVEQLCPAHEVQLVNYLTATKYEVGLLFNFGASSLQFKKKFRVYRKPDANPANPEKSC